MKKLVLAACMCMFLSVPMAYAACTAQDFQKEVMDLQTNMTELSKDPAKGAKASEALEEFQAEAMEFAKMAQAASGDPAKAQEMLDKGCDLYGRMNKRLNEFK